MMRILVENIQFCLKYIIKMKQNMYCVVTDIVHILFRVLQFAYLMHQSKYKNEITLFMMTEVFWYIVPCSLVNTGACASVDMTP